MSEKHLGTCAQTQRSQRVSNIRVVEVSDRGAQVTVAHAPCRSPDSSLVAQRAKLPSAPMAVVSPHYSSSIRMLDIVKTNDVNNTTLKCW